MDYSKIFLGILFGIIGQIGTFCQLQVSYKFGWYEKYPWIVILFSIPLGWFYILSVNNFIKGFGGQIWPSRLVGFGVGVIVFTLMSHFIFKEQLDVKNATCLLLGFIIVLIQLFVK
jgi:multidrug transporter EmrE-like cation transporter